MTKAFTKTDVRALRYFLVKLIMLPALFSAAPAAAATPDAKQAAHAHFDRGVTAFADKRFAEALDEFEAAYRAEPVFQVLYNIGQVNVALGRSVEAVAAYDEYLKAGASAIAAARRREVKDEIARQVAHIGTIGVATHPDGADIRLDGRLVGRTPLPAPIKVNPGKHTVEALLPAHGNEVREVETRGGSVESVQMTLVPLAPAARIETTPAKPAPALLAPVAPASASPVAAPPATVTTTAPPLRAPAAADTVTTRDNAAGPRSAVSWQRVAGLALGIGGLAAATTGGVLAYSGANQAHDAASAISRLKTTQSDFEAQWQAQHEKYTQGRDRNRLGWIVAGVGAGAVVGGVLLLASAPELSHDLAFAPWVAPGGEGGLLLHGAW
jgi:tetratricopeptide (TPR) repeat protein